MNPLTRVMVARLERPANSILEVHLVHVGSEVLAPWSPGAHIGLYLANGLVREYSLISDPTNCREWVVAVRREEQSRGGSDFIHDQLRVGDQLDVDGPKNHFLLEPASRYFLVAGGIGVTPLIPVAAHLTLLGLEWTMLYTGRFAAEMAYAQELCDRYGSRLQLHVDELTGGSPSLSGFLADVTDDDLVYCCGPEGLVKAVSTALGGPGRLRVERFRAPAREDNDSSRTSFSVLLAHSGQRIEVASSESLLEALDRSGVTLPRSCTEGICGTCEVGVLRGEVDHRDFLLTPEERARNDVMMACVSRARTDILTLDLPILSVADYEDSAVPTRQDCEPPSPANERQE